MVWILKNHEFATSQADEFTILDLRKPENCVTALTLADKPNKFIPLSADATPSGPNKLNKQDKPDTFNEVYQLAADMGGMGFIHSAECEIMHNSALININMIHAAATSNIPRYFFSSSVCVYHDMNPGEPELTENESYPANPDNEYGWEKLYSERLALAYSRHCGMKVRIARFQNTYGPEGTWTGGREKAPAAICRKVAEVKDGGTIEAWGDGSAVRSYTYISDLIEGIYLLMQSELESPVNIGSPKYFSVKQLIDAVAEVAGKRISIKWIDGPVGVQSRNFSNARIYSLGWKAKVSLKEGISLTYHWIKQQVGKSK